MKRNICSWWYGILFIALLIFFAPSNVLADEYINVELGATPSEANATIYYCIEDENDIVDNGEGTFTSGDTVQLQYDKDVRKAMFALEVVDYDSDNYEFSCFTLNGIEDKDVDDSEYNTYEYTHEGYLYIYLEIPQRYLQDLTIQAVFTKRTDAIYTPTIQSESVDKGTIESLDFSGNTEEETSVWTLTTVPESGYQLDYIQNESTRECLYSADGTTVTWEESMEGATYTAYFKEWEPIVYSVTASQMYYEAKSSGPLSYGQYADIYIKYLLLYKLEIASETLNLDIKIYAGSDASGTLLTEESIETDEIGSYCSAGLHDITCQMKIPDGLESITVTLQIDDREMAAKTVEVSFADSGEMNLTYIDLGEPDNGKEGYYSTADVGPNVYDAKAFVEASTGDLTIYYATNMGVIRSENGSISVMEGIPESEDVIAIGGEENALYALTRFPDTIDSVSGTKYNSGYSSYNVYVCDDGATWEKVNDDSLDIQEASDLNLTEGLVLGANSIWIQNYQWNGSAWNEQEVTFNSFWSDGGENAYAGSSEGLYQYQDGSWVLVSGLDNSRYTIVSGAMVDGVPTLILADLCYVDGRYRSDKPAKVYGPVYLVSLEESGTKKTAVDVSSFSSTKDGYGKWFASGMGIDGKGDVYVFTVAYGVNTNQFGGYTSNYVYKLVDGEWQYQIIDAFNDEKDLATIEAGGIPGIDSSKSRADGVRYTLNLCDGVTLFLGEDGANYALYGSATITFDAQGGSEVSSITQTVGSAVTAPSSPTRDGYEFVGWYTDSSCSDDSYYLFDTMPVAGITLYAGWTALSEIQTDAEQELAEALAAYTESDYTAESWAKLLEAYEAGKTAIESGASNAEIQSALEEAVKAMAAITADAETEPSTEATEPSTEATEPTTEATEPTTEATDTASRPEVGDTYKTGNVKYTVTGTNTVTATKVTDKTVTSVKIPKTVTIDGYTFKVTAIGESAFSGCKKLTSVSIGANVTVIEKKAFYHCTALTSVTIPSSVTKIKASAFEGCTALKKLKGCASVVAIGQRAFRRCTELTTIEGLSKTTYLGNRVFAHCKKLKTIGSTSGIVNLPKVKTLKAYAFYDCPAMKQVNLTSSSLKTIGKKTFYECTKLATVQGLTKVTSIGTRAFYGCTKLVTVGSKSGVVTLAKVKTVDEYAFCNCSSMKKVNLTSTALTSLGASSFRGCTKLTSFISKSAKLASIGRAAFYGDKKLASVKLATSKLTKSKVGEKAFKGIKSTCVFKVPAKKVSAYRKIFRARGAGSKITVKKNA